MKKSPRLLLWFIILLTVAAIIINLPPKSFFSITKSLSFKKGLDLAGGTSLTFKADMNNVPSDQRDQALRSAKEVIERRINIFGVSEPIIQTAKGEKDFRIIVELPGITNLVEAINLVGATAKLEFREVATTSATFTYNTKANYRGT